MSGGLGSLFAAIVGRPARKHEAPGVIGEDRDAEGAVRTGPRFDTALSGLYVAGAARSGYAGSLLGACGEGAAVATAVAQALKG